MKKSKTVEKILMEISLLMELCASSGVDFFCRHELYEENVSVFSLIHLNLP